MSNPLILHPIGVAPYAGAQSQISSATISNTYTSPDVVPGSYNPLSALADAADLCFRTGLDPDILKAAMSVQEMRDDASIANLQDPDQNRPSTPRISKSDNNKDDYGSQQQPSTASEIRFEHYKPPSYSDNKITMTSSKPSVPKRASTWAKSRAQTGRFKNGMAVPRARETSPPTRIQPGLITLRANSIPVIDLTSPPAAAVVKRKPEVSEEDPRETTSAKRPMTDSFGAHDGSKN